MKRAHKINHDWMPPTSPLHSDAMSERYAAEVDAAVRKAEKAWRQAQKNLQRAEARLAAALRGGGFPKRERKREIAELEAIAEVRHAELEECYRLMVSVGASAAHRGRKSYRPVPDRTNASGVWNSRP